MYFLLSFVDVDECQMGSHVCGVGQICHNLPGSYRCDCQTGYQFDALRKVCTGMLYCGRCAAHKLKYLGRFLNYSSCWLNFKKVWVFALLQTGDQFRVYPPWPNRVRLVSAALRPWKRDLAGSEKGWMVWYFSKLWKDTRRPSWTKQIKESYKES